MNPLVAFIPVLLLYLAIVGGIIFTAVHFIVKYW